MFINEYQDFDNLHKTLIQTASMVNEMENISAYCLNNTNDIPIDLKILIFEATTKAYIKDKTLNNEDRKLQEIEKRYKRLSDVWIEE